MTSADGDERQAEAARCLARCARADAKTRCVFGRCRQRRGACVLGRHGFVFLLRGAPAGHRWPAGAGSLLGLGRPGEVHVLVARVVADVAVHLEIGVAPRRDRHRRRPGRRGPSRTAAGSPRSARWAGCPSPAGCSCPRASPRRAGPWRSRTPARRARCSPCRGCPASGSPRPPRARRRCRRGTGRDAPCRRPRARRARRARPCRRRARHRCRDGPGGWCSSSRSRPPC